MKRQIYTTLSETTNFKIDVKANKEVSNAGEISKVIEVFYIFFPLRDKLTTIMNKTFFESYYLDSKGIFN